MSSNNELLEKARQCAFKAVEMDKSSQFESAIFYYLEASQALIDYKSQNDSNINSSLNTKLIDYISRAEQIKSHLKSLKNEQENPTKNSSSPKFKTQVQKDIEKCLCMLSDALDQDTENNLYEAYVLYTDAVDLYLKSIKKNESTLNNDENFQRLERYIPKGLQRAEDIKKIINKSKNCKDEINTKDADMEMWQTETNFDYLTIESDEESKPSNNNSNGQTAKYIKYSTNSKPLTPDELAVLRRGSFINKRNYVPFFTEIDSKEKFYFPIQFSDKDGKLALSKSQMDAFSRWARPDEIFEKPCLMMLVSSFSVKQTCISDCSFVASLTVCAQYERKFNKSLLSNIIYPKNKNGEPVYNPCGKYMICLTLNGCQRKIIIDDFLPVDKYNQLLCSLTSNKGELWVSLLEKAYMKVMGGYDFPGSNSNIDLHALTNWIPERLSIHGDHTDFNRDADFERMFQRLHNGDVLITIATGPLSKKDEERTGLVATHAYAVLDIRKLGDRKLFQLKNPWSHLRWKGNYSEYDIKNWNEETITSLNYDPKLACNIDNGIFWIDYDSLIQFFDVFYLSWNPRLFDYTSSFHRKWSASEGPIKDRYNLGENPQYVLKVKCKSASNNKRCSTWLLLTRHIIDKADFAENKEYIALVVYKNSAKRIYYPMEPAPYKEGVRINSPHYLVKLVDDEPGPIFYNLVISQYEKYNSIYYTLRAYSTQPFELDEIKEPYKSKYSKKITGKWQGITAGGCSNYETCKNNPIYQLTLQNNESDNCIKIELKGPQQYSVGFDIICANSNVPNNPNNFKKTSSGDYRKGFCVLPLYNMSGGTYTIRPSTYLPQQEGPFFLEIASNREFLLMQNQ